MKEEQLKEQITPEIIKKMCELAEGFDFVQDKSWDGGYYIITKPQGEYSWSYGSLVSDDIILPLLLHRAVEGVNKKSLNEQIVIYPESINISKELYYDDGTFDKEFCCQRYQPSHLTPCEMAILDCLIGVLK